MTTTAIRGATAHGSWILNPVSNPTALLRLFCFPYAGGGASIFSNWSRTLPPEVDICAIHMPGREARLHEPPLTRWADVIDRLAGALRPWMDRPFAFFGHSLGAGIAFELARRLRRDQQPGLMHLFVSGGAAPHLPLDRPLTHGLPEAEFIDAIRSLAGTPDEILQDPELMAVFVPILRADFGLSERYMYQEVAPLAVPISSYGGIDDRRVPRVKLEAWRRHTACAFRVAMFNGGHFFLHDSRQAVLSTLTRELRGILSLLRYAPPPP